MTATKERLAQVPIPTFMRSLPKDPRGFPTPWIVLRDRSGRAQFTINDQRRVKDCLTKRLCSICGRRIALGYWFIGGSRCFTHMRGAFIDPPLHLDCAEYALRVCPFLALPSYAKRIDDKLLKPEHRPHGLALYEYEFVGSSQPAWFGLGHTDAFRRSGDALGEILFVDRWNYVEFWRAGQPVNAPAFSEIPA